MYIVSITKRSFTRISQWSQTTPIRNKPERRENEGRRTISCVIYSKIKLIRIRYSHSVLRENLPHYKVRRGVANIIGVLLYSKKK